MRNLRTLIQSPGALFAFEAAARLGSFTKAGRELNVTQAAVSFSVKQLERALGVALFDRNHRRVVLTQSGERFFHELSIGLAHIRRSAEAIRSQHDVRHVTLSVSTAFASYWMLPRLMHFRERHPEIDLRLQTTDKDVDLGAEGIALGIRRGHGAWLEYEAALLAPEEIYPVCSPSYLSNSALTGIPELLHHNLIHLEEPFRPRPSWEDWFASHEIPFRDTGEGLRLNDYALVIQAALEGQGIALGWDHLTADLVARGQLVKPIDVHFRTGFGFYVVSPKVVALDHETSHVRDWMLSWRNSGL